MTQHFTTFDGLRLAYSDAGRGRPVLCLAGLTRNMADFDYLAPHLTGVRLIRMDYRGRGGSDWADDPASYAIPVEAQDVLALLDHLGVDRTAIIGTSRGGLVAMALAATSRDRLAGVCLNDIGPEIAPDGLAAIAGFLGRRLQFATQKEMAAALPGLMPGFANVPDSRWLEEAARRSVQTGDGLGLNYDPRLREPFEAASAAEPPDLWPYFDALKGLPLALIRGAGSNILSAKTAAEMRRRRPDMIFAEVPDRGHVPFLDEPQALAAITAWLELIP